MIQCRFQISFAFILCHLELLHFLLDFLLRPFTSLFLLKYLYLLLVLLNSFLVLDQLLLCLIILSQLSKLKLLLQFLIVKRVLRIHFDQFGFLSLNFTELALQILEEAV
jgi:hypothetical protein